MHPHTNKLMETNTNTTEAKQPASAGCYHTPCSPDVLSTPETDSIWQEECCSGRSWYQIAENVKIHARVIERQLNKARDAMAYLATQWEECEKRRDEEYDRNAQTIRQRDELAEALREMRYCHTDKAERMAVKALSYLDNAIGEARADNAAPHPPKTL